MPYTLGQSKIALPLVLRESLFENPSISSYLTVNPFKHLNSHHSDGNSGVYLEDD